MRKRTHHHRTAEQIKATEALVAVAGRLRVIADAEGWPVIPGRLGVIEHDGRLTAYTGSARMVAKLLAVPGVERYQRGDSEVRVLVEPGAVAAVGRLLGCRYRRSVEPDMARVRANSPVARGARAPQERRGSASPAW